MPTLFDQLLGSWELVSYELELDGGRTIHPLGEDAVGSIVYTHTGTFTVDEPASVVEHHVSVSLFPNWIGDVQKRFAELEGDELVLESPAITDAAGISVTPRLRWRRIN